MLGHFQGSHSPLVLLMCSFCEADDWDHPSRFACFQLQLTCFMEHAMLSIHNLYVDVKLGFASCKVK